MAKDANDILSMISGIDNQDNKKDVENNLQIENSINYSKLLEEILNEFNFNLNVFSFNFHSNNFILSLVLNKIKAFKRKEENKKIYLNSEIENLNLSIESPKIKNKYKRLLENNHKILINYGFNEEIVKGELKSIYLNLGMEENESRLLQAADTAV